MTTKAHFTRWKNRDAIALDNGVLRAVALAGGGHLAELRLVNALGSSCNALWEAPWPTADPDSQHFAELSEQYGGTPAGPFLAGFTGQALCLDTFGPPDTEDEARGATLHGEACLQTWKMTPTSDGCTMEVELPRAKLHFSRNLRLGEGQSALFVHEQLVNTGSASRELHWVQHVTLGPPLLARGQSCVEASVDACRTWPLGYEGKALLPDNAEFAWPRARTLLNREQDLRLPFQSRSKGFVLAARVHPAKQIGFIVALNWKLRLALLYCFRREDFPWIAIWEENGARTAAPWRGTAKIRGMEFGSTPMPLGKAAIRAMGSLFETPSARVVPAGGMHAARYVACLATIPSQLRNVKTVEIAENTLVLNGAGAEDRIVIPAAGVRQFLLTNGDRN
ncbi:MAG TPA: hypothetical protein VGM11_12955 [Acidobacteriaceae bacterium]|jgi:hypothetical protein